jgi:hypothetical protein
MWKSYLQMAKKEAASVTLQKMVTALEADRQSAKEDFHEGIADIKEYIRPVNIVKTVANGLLSRFTRKRRARQAAKLTNTTTRKTSRFAGLVKFAFPYMASFITDKIKNRWKD